MVVIDGLAALKWCKLATLEARKVYIVPECVNNIPSISWLKRTTLQEYRFFLPAGCTVPQTCQTWGLIVPYIGIAYYGCQTHQRSQRRTTTNSTLPAHINKSHQMVERHAPTRNTLPES